MPERLNFPRMRMRWKMEDGNGFELRNATTMMSELVNRDANDAGFTEVEGTFVWY